ncbi:lytic transglycosylase domain-containing protein [Inquilinus limosus]|uniref:lytic transglycosylase domain-containing protein n=1 Tax=Inquilinus limosus TaxID=171674 RepID=UPI003F181DE8
MPGTNRWTRTVAATALLAGLLAACAETPKPKPQVAYRGEWGAEIHEASRRFNIPEEWIRAVMQVESGGQTHWKGGQPITSHAGAMGLMQVMPDTYEELRWSHGLGGDPYEPRDNIMAGAAYIREMYDLYGYPGFLGAYNAGPERYRQYVEEGRPLPRETRRYMDIIAPQIAGILPDGGSDRMTQYAANQIQQKVPAAIRMAPIPDGSSTRNTTVVAAMKPIPDGSSTRGATVVAAMKPIPDGSSTASALPPVRVVQPGPVQMRPIPDGGTTQVAAAAPAARPAVPAPVRMAPIPDGSTQVADAAPAARPAAPAPVRMAPIPDAPAARAQAAETQVAAVTPAPVPAARAAVAPTRMAPIPDALPARVASAKTGRAQPLQQVADASEPRRQANGLPAGWFVPSAPVK